MRVLTIRMCKMSSVCLIFSLLILKSHAQFQWQARDAFDKVRDQIDKVTVDNCNVKLEHELKLDEASLSHIPDSKLLEVNPIFPNRTALLHLHNMALSRSFFFSYILQKAIDDYEPGMMYYFLSVIADVAANPRLNASAIYFAPNMSYSPSYRGFFNKTFPLFAPRAFRSDDFNDPFHLMRVSTMNTIEAMDLGAIRKDQTSLNYSDDGYRINEWFKHWLPDHTDRQDTKMVYYVTFTYANNTNFTFNWHGPPGLEETVGPVKWITPYFDCGRSDKWITGATSPIPDIYPRHTQYRHIELPRYGSVVAMEMDYDRIDINQCPRGPGNAGPNRFAETARCREETTECEPLQGYGFRRGGYQCRCKPGYRLPFIIRQPYLGEIIERATTSEYENGFQCQKVGYTMILPQNWERVDEETRRRYMGIYQYKEPQPWQTQRWTTFQELVKRNVSDILRYIRNDITPFNCHNRKSELEMMGDVSFGVEVQFENQARMALRLANFLSSFLQIVDPTEQFGELRLADQPLTEDQVFGEAVATVMGDIRVWGTGVFWDRGKFAGRTHFAPFAYKKEQNVRSFYAEDLTRRKGDDLYLKKPWFKLMKTRWSTTTDDLEEFILKIKIRGNSSGEYVTKYDHYPVRYRAAEIRHGMWTAPYYDCGLLNQWVVSYVSPFFGWDSIRSKLEFKGVVMVSVPLEKLDVNQCTMDYTVSNAFKGTHRCDLRYSMCIPMLGRGFDSGGYKCECEQGYEYPYETPVNYFDGQLMEAEFDNMVLDKPSRFDLLKCRIAGASSVEGSLVTLLALFIFSLFMMA